jgi:translation initiation factor IF-3
MHKKKQKNVIRFRKNDEIKIIEVRLVGDNVEGGVMPTSQALKIARQMDLDLVEVNAGPNPSICKILEYDKFLYQEKKKTKEFEINQKKNAKKPKEIRLGPNTGDHDLDFKSKQAIEFLEKGFKVYVNILFKGRNIVHQERGEATLLKFATLVQDTGIPESLPKLTGRKMEMYLKPNKKN